MTWVIARLVRLTLVALVLPLLVIARLLRPIVQFQVCVVGSQRFGHLALEPEMWLANQKICNERGRPRIVNVWSLGSRKTQSNRYLVTLWRRRIRVVPSWIVSAVLRAGEIAPRLALKRSPLSIHGPKNALDVVSQQCPAPNDFTEEEVDELQNLGVDITRPYVALVVRDSSYYAARGESEDRHMSILNADLEKFVPTCEYLVARGLQVVRLGGPSSQRLRKAPGQADYANSEIRSPELDVKLAMKCEFVIATQTGPDAVALLGRRPVLYVDVLRFSQFFFGTRLATWLPVKFFDPVVGRPWSLSELCKSPLLHAKDPKVFSESGIEFLRVDATELRESVADYADELAFGVDEGVNRLRESINQQLSSAMGSWGQSQFGDVTAQVSRLWLSRNMGWWVPGERRLDGWSR